MTYAPSCHRSHLIISQLSQGAFDTPSAQALAHLRTLFIQAHPDLPLDGFWLMGTEGCHLCEESWVMLTTLKERLLLPPLYFLDIINLNDTLLDILSLHIPILLTPTALLVYPFGLMDIMALQQH